MYIEKIVIQNFRAFQSEEALHSGYEIKLGRHITCISGHNGIGKSTILAMLSNCAELKLKYGRLLNGDKFSGDYSTIIKYDERSDTPGHKCTIYFENLPEMENKENDNIYVKKLGFRAATQGKDSENPRYRLIPIKTEERNNEKKINWPVYYLGLSRLFPVGESDEVDKKLIKDNKISEIIKEYKNFLVYIMTIT